MKIYAQKGSRLNDDDRLEIARLLIKDRLHGPDRAGEEKMAKAFI